MSNIEIERKYIVEYIPLEYLNDPMIIEQGYFNTVDGTVVRVRIQDRATKCAYLTIKSKRINITCSEYEYSIPVSDAREMMDELVDGSLTKVRYHFTYKGKLFEVDFFRGKLKGLVVMEVELNCENEFVELPSDITCKETFDEAYNNINLAKGIEL